MSNRISICDDFSYDSSFELGDYVSFLNDGDRLKGRVVRVYASRLNYHVEVDGQRYEVSVPDDDIRREQE